MKIRWFKIYVGDILGDHFKSLVNTNTNRPDWTDYLTFAIVPLALTVALALLKCSFENNIGNAISALAIFIGLFFNVCLLVIDVVKKNKISPVETILYKQIIANICFVILLSILCIITLLLTQIKFQFVKDAFTWLSFFVIAEFGVTLLMVLKRIYKVFIWEFERNHGDKNNPKIDSKND